MLNAQLNLTLEESTILELEARKTSLTDSTQSQIDSLSEEQLYVKTASAKSIATCPAGKFHHGDAGPFRWLRGGD